MCDDVQLKLLKLRTFRGRPVSNMQAQIENSGALDSSRQCQYIYPIITFWENLCLIDLMHHLG
jgi:hypothetical protein